MLQMIEDKRSSNRTFWRLAVKIKDFLWKSKFYLGGVIVYFISLIINIKDIKKAIRLNGLLRIGKKLIVFDGDQRYFFDNFEPIYSEYSNTEYIYFINPFLFNKSYFNYLLKNNIPPKKIISASYAFLINWTVYLNSWIPRYFPNPLLNNRVKYKIEMYHGISASTFESDNFNSKDNRKELKKFNIHFAIGPQLVKPIRNLDSSIKIFNTGYPRMDKFYNKSLEEESVLEEFNMKHKWPIVVYSPHHLKDSSFKNSVKIIKTLLGMKINVILKIHEAAYLYKEYVEIIKTLKKIKADNFFFASKTESTPYYVIADAVITDVCSTATFESCLVDKPTIIIPNLNWLKENKEHIQLEKLAMGSNYLLEFISDLEKLIPYVLENKNKKHLERKDLVNRAYYNLGKSTLFAKKILNELT